LSLGATSTTIEVSGGADLVQTSNATLANTFDTHLVTELPNNGGTPLQLALLSPAFPQIAPEFKETAAQSVVYVRGQMALRLTVRTTTM